ncbi:ABC-type antimicrobial peptide transport system, ATPase component [hydrothermal vent metagenome]|uniref:ABC-type antimicrobial peptide transport system, ATPase component n=1 Tax=hydrothermal vent metagenome TaxID=652676 RepID=A0A3B1C2K3_9ZZZZ
MKPEAVITAKNLHKRVVSPEGELSLLHGVNLSIAAGETVAVVGASGAGKSTLLGLLAGLDTPTEGSISIAGQDLFALDEDGRARLRGEKVGFVFQAFQLLPNLTALENVMLPLELAGRHDAHQVATEVLDRVGLSDRSSHYPKQLSGGEQQRVAIARAFAPHPQVLFADEPTGNLDRHTGERIIDLLFQLNAEQGTTLILVTHDLHLAERCQRQLELDEGQLKTELQ